MSNTESSSPARGTLLGPSRFLDPSTGAFVQFVDISNLETAALRRIPIGFFGHGISVDPVSEQGFVDGLASAILRLARDPELLKRLSIGAMARSREDYLDWDSKADRVLEILKAMTDKTADARSVSERP